MLLVAYGMDIKKDAQEVSLATHLGIVPST